MEYEHQEKEWNSDEELESDAEYETLESHEMTGSHDEASESHDEASGLHDNDGKSFAVPDVSADIAKGKVAKQQLGKGQIYTIRHELQPGCMCKNIPQCMHIPG